MATDSLREIAEQLEREVRNSSDPSAYRQQLERAMRLRDQAWHMIITSGVTEEELNEVTAELLK
jgi:hypothetical protein